MVINLISCAQRSSRCWASVHGEPRTHPFAPSEISGRALSLSKGRPHAGVAWTVTVIEPIGCSHRLLPCWVARRERSVWGCSGNKLCSTTRFFGCSLRMTCFVRATYFVYHHKAEPTIQLVLWFFMTKPGFHNLIQD